MIQSISYQEIFNFPTAVYATTIPAQSVIRKRPDNRGSGESHPYPDRVRFEWHQKRSYRYHLGSARRNVDRKILHHPFRGLAGIGKTGIARSLGVFPLAIVVEIHEHVEVTRACRGCPMNSNPVTKRHGNGGRPWNRRCT